MILNFRTQSENHPINHSISEFNTRQGKNQEGKWCTFPIAARLRNNRKAMKPCIFVVNKWDTMVGQMPTERWGDYLQEKFDVPGQKSPS